MQAVVPAAGEGTRLRPLTDDRPKGLVEVDGEPLLTRLFDRLLAVGVEEFVVVVGYRGGDVVAHYGDAYRGVPVRYVHQRERKGLAHALLQADPHVEDDFLLVNGDNVFDANANLGDVVARHRETGAAATALAERVSEADARETGVFEVDEGRVVGMVEKPDDPPSRLVSAGCYAFSPAVFEACRLVRPSERGEYELSDAVDVLLAAGAGVDVVELEGWRVNVNTPEDVERAADRL